MSTKRVNEIDLLRFLAAFSVVLFHYTFRGYAADSMSAIEYPGLAPYTKYAYFGVELFFMISGFVILMTAAGSNISQFAISRIIRLYPAFWACCTITFAFTLAIGYPTYTASLGQYLANLTMLSGFFNIPSIDGAYWSLFVEIRFYIMIAIVLVIGRIQKAELLLILWIGASGLIELWPSGKLRYFLIVEYSAYFIAGATYYLIWSKGLSMTRILMLLSTLALAIIECIADLKKFEAHYNVEMSRSIAISIILLIYFAMFMVSTRKTGLIGRGNWTLIGSLTYPLYLLHQNIGFMIFNRSYQKMDPNIILVLTIAFVLSLAAAVHHLVERKSAPPMKEWLKKLLIRPSSAA